MTSRRERLRNLFGAGHIHRPGHGHSSTASHAPHPPRASETRGFTGAGLFVRSPSLRATPEQDVLQDELPDDIEFLSLDNSRYDEPDTYEQDDLDTIDEDRDYRHESGSSGQGSSLGDNSADDDDDDMKDWPDEVDPADSAVHLDGVPRSDKRLAARQYKLDHFAQDLLQLLQHDLKVSGWASLPEDTSPDQVSVYKVSGSLTNAVFFISIPQSDESASTTNGSSPNGRSHEQSVKVQPPTVLLRIYGPSSGNLVSRRKELHVLNTLSACYGIGPAILGTFANGRVEEYFESRALYKDEMRDPRISRWIARRMRELHSVDLSLMELPSDHPKSPFFGPTRRGSSDLTRPGLSNLDSGLSAMSTSSASSIRSFSSSYSELSTTSGPHSPALNARASSRPGVSEGQAPRKKRSTSSIGSRADFSLEGDKFNKPRSVVWQNIDSWTKAAKRVLNKVDKLEEVVKEISQNNPQVGKGDFIYDVNPLNAPSLLAECRRLLDIQAFQQQVKNYRKFVHQRETQGGRSKRVFAHNDAQSGNLLKLTPGGKDEIVPGLKFPHEMIIVVDFEYAGVNPRGFDIANHFLEWQTDYHHPSLSHSLTKHSPGPTVTERQRFYRAYVPCDGAFDTGDEPPIPPLAEDDPRVQRLEEEVQLWTAASHAMYTVWSVVQATDDIVRRIDEWLADHKQAEAAELKVHAYRQSLVSNGGHGKGEGRPKVERSKSGETIWLEKPTSEEAASLKDGGQPEGLTSTVELQTIGDFDYMSYALERATLFRQNIAQFGL